MTSNLQVITPRAKDIGGFEVRRALPAANRRTVGPFVFFDQMGPARFTAGTGMDVRPHPHVCLATITYLFEGEIMHRDSLGFEQAIRPGDVNLMVAGRGIVHSERTAPEARPTGPRLHGIQTWIGLPAADEETPPAFYHHPAHTLPQVTQGEVTMRLIIGEAFGERAPLTTFSPIFYLDAPMPAGAQVTLPDDYPERAAYVAEGAVHFDGEQYATGTMVIFPANDEIVLTAAEDSRVMLFGGAPLDGPRHMWWNFIASNPERIEQAKRDWKDGRFDGVPGDTEFIPLPED